MSREPIAVIGISCLLPGASNPGEFWDLIANRRHSFREVSAARLGIRPSSIQWDQQHADLSVSTTCAFVDQKVDLSEFRDSIPEIDEWDPYYQWTFHLCSQALADAGKKNADHSRTGLVLGNLAFATESSEKILEDALVHALESHLKANLDLSPRAFKPSSPDVQLHHSARPAQLCGKFFNFGIDPYAIDAACASSLYVVDLACRALWNQEADMMLAMGVNRAEMVAMQVGFSQLGAYSSTHRCRPFDQNADGLVVGEGGGALVLKPLSKAIRDQDQIYCLIMGTGLSGDGSEGGLLTPSSRGQVQAMQSAYQSTGIDPSSIDFLECHGTGTPVGDSVEMQSTATVFQSGRKNPLMMGSVKSMVGHCLSAAGMASLLKVILAMKAKKLPPTLMEAPCEFLRENPGWIAPVLEVRDWNRRETPRRACVSGFGFGGTNAHTILQEWDSSSDIAEIPAREIDKDSIAITAMDCEIGAVGSLSDLREALMVRAEAIDQAEESLWPDLHPLVSHQPSQNRFLKDREIPIGRFRMTPREMEHLLPQQLFMLELADRCLRSHSAVKESLDPGKTGVVIGLNWHPHLANHTIRLKAERSLSTLLTSLDLSCDEEQWTSLLQEYKELISAPVVAEDVIGDIPNFPANRIATEFNFQGPSFVVFQEENSGLKALEIARAYLSTHLVDAMIVGAVDLPLDWKYYLANQEEIRSNIHLSDGGAVLVLQRSEDVKNRGLSSYAKLESLSSCSAGILDQEIEDSKQRFSPWIASTLDPEQSKSAAGLRDSLRISQKVGYSRAAHGLVGVVASSLMIGQHWLPMQEPGKSSGYLPWLRNEEDPQRRILLHSSSRDDYHHLIVLGDSGETADVQMVDREPVLSVFSGRNSAEIIENLESNRQVLDTRKLPNDHKVLAVVSRNQEEWKQRISQSLEYLKKNPSQILDPRGTYYQSNPIYQPGSLALVYPGFGNVYPGMGRELLTRFPKLVQSMEKRNSHTRTLGCSEILWEEREPDLYSMSVLEISSATTVLSLAYTRLFIDSLGLNPERIIGFSGGEINSMSALGLWDVNSYFEDATNSELFKSIACGEFKALPERFHTPSPVSWQVYLIQSDEHRVQELCKGIDGVYLLMVNAPSECMIGGLEHRCLEALSGSGLEYKRIPMPQIYHSDLLEPFRDELFQLWNRELRDPGDLIFYSHASGQAYRPNRENIANALVNTCIQCVKFEPVIERAYEDGVRIFLELGPNASVSRYIQKILGDREYLTVAVNLKERSELLQLAHALGNLLSHGVRLDLSEFSKNRVERELVSSENRVMKLPVRTREIRSDWLGFCERLSSLHSINADGDAPVSHEESSVAKEEFAMSMSAGDPSIQKLQQDFFEAQNRVTDLHHHFLKEQEYLLQLESGNYPTRNSGEDMAQTQELSKEPALFNYEDILEFSHGKIASIFGPEFDVIDTYPFRTRFPSPPYLLVSRVMEMDGKTHEFKPSRVVTEFDVSPEDWFLVDGRVPISVCIESGQADLFLISYLGIDHKVKGERVYRLLGADFTFFDSPPKAPCTLRYEIKITSFVEHEGTWLFFFEGVGTCGGKRFIQWVNGCAGYFTPEELLAKGASELPLIPEPTAIPAYSPVRTCLKSVFGPEDLKRLVSGDMYGCFGSGFEVPFPSAPGTQRTIPQWVNHDLRMVDEIEIFNEKGTHGLGYIRARLDLFDEHWYFTSHFVTDNVMPGTLMLDGCTQVMEFYLLYCGLGFQARGGRFQPIQDQQIKVKCRGQVIPGMRDLSYHVEITGIENGHRPRVFANALITSEGKEVVWIENLGIEVVYDGLPSLPQTRQQAVDRFSRPVKANEVQMLELTTGLPSRYFGEDYKAFDHQRKLSRMPNPPFSCITRVLEMEGTARDLSPGATLVTEMDLYPDDWFFQTNQGLLPFCILSEALLQPCGLLAQFLEHDLLSDKDRFIRNLAGKARIEPIPTNYNTSRLVCRVRLNSATHMPDIFLVSFSGIVEDQDGNLIMEGKDLSFGFFTRQALSQSPGFPLEKGESIPAKDPLPLQGAPTPDQVGSFQTMPLEPCLFFDDVTRYEPEGSETKLPFIETLKRVRPEEWIFSSHFYEDPVMPGSYSLDAITQILRYIMIVEGMEVEGLTFVTSPMEWMEWEYKGQIEITNKEVVYRVEVLEQSTDPNPYLRARAAVFCDGKPIYRLNSVSAALV